MRHPQGSLASSMSLFGARSYETLMQQSVADYETMKAALPRCMQMIQQDLQAIVDQVSVDRGSTKGDRGGTMCRTK